MTISPFAIVYYLHDEPTPPTGDSASSINLLIDTTAATAPSLYNYDSNRDSSAGLLIAKGGTGASETDPEKYQNWRTSTFASARTINGSATLVFWSAIKDFGLSKQGSVQAFLRDFNPATSSYTNIADSTLTVADWQGGSGTWRQKTLTVSVSSYTIAAGHRLELNLIVTGSSDDDMWFAYDTTGYPSSLTVP